MEDQAHEINVDGFNQCTRSFLSWLHQNGVTISPKIEISDLRSRSAGRGVLATQDISEDEELFTIPRSSIMTVETSTVPSEITDQVEDPWLSLILTMVCEYQHAAGSRWKAYFDILPKTFDTLMYWSEEELQYLQGSAVLDKIGKVSANETFREQLLPILKQHAETGHVAQLSDDALLALCHRMGSTIMAYAFDLERSTSGASEEQDGWEEDSSDAGETLPKGMVPFADILNADADKNNAKLFYEDDKVVMKAVRPIRQGDEVLNDYGLLPRADVLRRYGYVTDNYAPYDVVELSLKLIRDVVKKQPGMKEEELEARLAYLDEQGVLDDGYIVCRADNEDGQFPEELCILVNALSIPKDDFEKLQRKEKLPKAELSSATARLLAHVLRQREAIYPTIPDEQSTYQAGVETKSRRRLMASQVIQGEKAVLREALDALEGLMSVGVKRSADSTGSDRSLKRQR